MHLYPIMGSPQSKTEKKEMLSLGSNQTIEESLRAIGEKIKLRSAGRLKTIEVSAKINEQSKQEIYTMTIKCKWGKAYAHNKKNIKTLIAKNLALNTSDENVLPGEIEMEVSEDGKTITATLRKPHKSQEESKEQALGLFQIKDKDTAPALPSPLYAKVGLEKNKEQVERWQITRQNKEIESPPEKKVAPLKAEKEKPHQVVLNPSREDWEFLIEKANKINDSSNIKVSNAQPEYYGVQQFLDGWKISPAGVLLAYSKYNYPDVNLTIKTENFPKETLTGKFADKKDLEKK